MATERIQVETAQWVEEYARQGPSFRVGGSNLGEVTRALDAGDYSRAGRIARVEPPVTTVGVRLAAVLSETEGAGARVTLDIRNTRIGGANVHQMGVEVESHENQGGGRANAMVVYGGKAASELAADWAQRTADPIIPSTLGYLAHIVEAKIFGSSDSERIVGDPGTVLPPGLFNQVVKAERVDRATRKAAELLEQQTAGRAAASGQRVEFVGGGYTHAQEALGNRYNGPDGNGGYNLTTVEGGPFGEINHTHVFDAGNAEAAHLAISQGISICEAYQALQSEGVYMIDGKMVSLGEYESSRGGRR